MTLIKKVRFYKFVQVKQVTGDSKDRKGNIKLKTRNQAVKIWFTGITGMNTTYNKKPEVLKINYLFRKIYFF